MRNEIIRPPIISGEKPKFFLILFLLLLSVIGYRLLVSEVHAALSCNSCHGKSNAYGFPDYTSYYPTKGNSHSKHPTTCETCHVEVTTGAYTISFATNHVNGVYDVKGSAGNIVYDKTTSSCTTNYCHSINYWGGPALSCSNCHDANGATVNESAGALGGASNSIANEVDMAQFNDTGHGNTGTYDANTINGGGGNTGANKACYSASETNPSGGCHASLAQHSPTTASGNPYRIVTNFASDLNGLCSYAGCHTQSLENHIESLFNSPNHVGAWGFQPKCTDCHDPHGDGTTIGNIFMIHNKVHNAGSNSYGVPTSSEAVTFSDDTVADNWGDRTASAGNKICETCHTVTTVFKTTGGDSSHYATDACDGCHTHAAAFEGSGECIGCHNGAKGPRRPIKPEFLLTWSHRRSTSTAHPVARDVSNNDCAVCHLEGNVSNGSINSTWHKEFYTANGVTTNTPVGNFYGFINLRDPDSTTQNTMIKLSSWSATGKIYQNNINAHTGYLYKVTTDGFQFVQFRRDTTKKDLEPWTISVQNNLCLKCHDYDGCVSTWVPGGSALRPFNTNVIYTTYTATRVLDVSVQLSTEGKNASYHPVRGRQDNSYCDINTLEAPWGGTGTIDKTAGTKSFGYLISCWDCHNRASPSVLSSGTVTAHGGNTTLRAAYHDTTSGATQEATLLCLVCHKNAVYVALNADKTLSALDDTTLSKDHCLYLYEYQASYAYTYNCGACHGSKYQLGGNVGRPTRAEDAHGFNKMLDGSATWPTTGAPPFSFIRNTTNLSNTGKWRPKSWGGTSPGAQCGPVDGTECDTGGKHASATYSYTPGGAY